MNHPGLRHLLKPPDVLSRLRLPAGFYLSWKYTGTSWKVSRADLLANILAGCERDSPEMQQRTVDGVYLGPVLTPVATQHAYTGENLYVTSPSGTTYYLNSDYIPLYYPGDPE